MNKKYFEGLKKAFSRVESKLGAQEAQEFLRCFNREVRNLEEIAKDNLETPEGAIAYFKSETMKQNVELVALRYTMRKTYHLHVKSQEEGE